MKMFIPTLKWLFLRPWPLWVTVVIGIIHYLIYCGFTNDAPLINKFVSSSLQLVGGLVVLYSVNQNMGMFKRGNFWLIFTQWCQSFPPILKPISGHSGVRLDCILSLATGTVKRECNTIEERLDELERQINECNQLIRNKEQELRKELSDVTTRLETAICTNNKEIEDVKKLLNETVVGGMKVQVFGVMLVIYGGLLGYFV